MGREVVAPVLDIVRPDADAPADLDSSNVESLESAPAVPVSDLCRRLACQSKDCCCAKNHQNRLVEGSHFKSPLCQQVVFVPLSR